MRPGLETSVVVRLLIGEPEAQYRAARERLQRAHAEGVTWSLLEEAGLTAHPG